MEKPMKATALIAAAALVCGTAAYAQQDRSVRHDDKARVEQQDHNRAGSSLGDDMHRLGEKIRNGVHRLGDKLHAKADRHDDTRAMGAAGDDHGRSSRMDDAYSNWRSQHERNERDRDQHR
jgi:hypothetical protein